MNAIWRVVDTVWVAWIGLGCRVRGHDYRWLRLDDVSDGRTYCGRCGQVFLLFEERDDG